MASRISTSWKSGSRATIQVRRPSRSATEHPGIGDFDRLTWREGALRVVSVRIAGGRPEREYIFRRRRGAMHQEIRVHTDAVGRAKVDVGSREIHIRVGDTLEFDGSGPAVASLVLDGLKKGE